jgi:hypothetical protein
VCVRACVRACARVRPSVRLAGWLAVCLSGCLSVYVEYDTGAMVWAIPYSNIRVDVEDILTREIDTKLFAVEFCGLLRC